MNIDKPTVWETGNDITTDAKLIKAIIQAKKELGNKVLLGKNRDGYAGGAYKYSDLTQIIDTIKEVETANGLMIIFNSPTAISNPEGNKLKLMNSATIYHESGESITVAQNIDVPLNYFCKTPGNQTSMKLAQEIQTTATFFRRYVYKNVYGLVEESDDELEQKVSYKDEPKDKMNNGDKSSYKAPTAKIGTFGAKKDTTKGDIKEATLEEQLLNNK